MNKKVAIIAIALVACIILGGLNNTFLFTTQYLDTRAGYEYDLGEPASWWDCNWSYCKKIIIDHDLVESDQSYFPILIYNNSDTDLRDYAQDDGDDIVFVDSSNLSQYDHELEKFDGSTGEIVAWVELISIDSDEDTILYMYYGNPDCENQQNITSTWNDNYKLVQHLNESSGVHYDSTANYNNGTVSGSITQGTTEAGLPQMDGLDFFSDGSGVIDFGTDNSLAPNSFTLEAWVKDPPIHLLNQNNKPKIIDKRDEKVVLSSVNSLCLSRKISGYNTNLIFVALYSDGVEINDLILNNNSIYSGKYLKNNPSNHYEKSIENIRQKLPKDLKKLNFLAYSGPFVIKNNSEINIIAKQNKSNLNESGNISYLLISDDGSFDFECTTHWKNIINFFKPPYFLYDFINQLLGKQTFNKKDDKKNSEKYQIPFKNVYHALEKEEKTRVILKTNWDENDYVQNYSYLENIGFKNDARLESKGILSGEIESNVLEQMLNQIKIEDIYLDNHYELLLNESLPIIKYNQTFETFGLTGKGIKVCLLDTGVDSSVVNYSYGYDFVNYDDEPFDDHGHGTRVASILKSVAPDIDLIVAKVIDSSGSGYESDVLEGLYYCLEQDPDIILFSIGTTDGCLGFCDENLVASICNQAVGENIFIIAAAGNGGSTHLVSPACGSNVFSVGSTNDFDDIADFSNVNPTLDLFAPGVYIHTEAGSGSGTSLSAPFVAGASALLLENEFLNPIDLKYRLRSTGNPIYYIYNQSLKINISRLDIYNAVTNNKTVEPYDYSYWFQDDITTLNYTILETETFYFNEYNSKERWESNPENMVDEEIESFANSRTNGQVQFLNSNNCGYSGSANISKIELRACGYYSSDGDIILRPIKAGSGDGDNHQIGITVLPGWSDWIDITTDWGNQTWSWSDIESLDCDVEATDIFRGQVFCSYVQMRVTYNIPPDFSSVNPEDGSINVPLNTTDFNINIEDPEGDGFYWQVKTSPYVGNESSRNTSQANGTYSCELNGLKPDTTYTVFVNATDSGSNIWTNETYTFKTESIQLLNCSTNKSFYKNSETIYFEAWAIASNATNVTLLIANSTSNLTLANYTNRNSCIANSSNISVETSPFRINCSLNASEDSVWYAKLCDDEGRISYFVENTTLWNKTYNGGYYTGLDRLEGICVNSQDDVFAVGDGYRLNGTTTYSDYWVMKFNKEGDREWNKTFQGGDMSDSAQGVGYDSNDNVYVVGYGHDLNSSESSTDWWIMKFNGSTGVREWNKTYNGGNNAGSDSANSIAIDSNDNIYIAGYGQNLNSSSSVADWWIMKFNGSTGVREWNKTYNGGEVNGNDYARGIAIDSDDNVYLTGNGMDLNNTDSDSDLWIMKFNGSTGAREWNKTYNSGYSDRGYSISFDSNNKVYFCGFGYHMNSTSSYQDWWIMRFNISTGAREWNKTFQGGANGAASEDWLFDIDVDSADNIYAVGRGEDIVNETTQSDLWLMIFDNNGDRLINKTFNGGDPSGDDCTYSSSLEFDSEGNFYIGTRGYNLNNSDSRDDWWLKRFDVIKGEFKVDSKEPNISFISPTPENNSYTNDTWIHVNLSTYDVYQHYSFIDFDKSCVLWLKMDDINDTSDPQDSSSYNHHSLKYNDAVQNDVGIFGKSFHFDGDNDYVETPVSANFKVDSTQEMTWSFWVYLYETGTDYCLIDKGNFGSEGYAFSLDGGNIVFIEYQDGGYVDGPELSSGGWNHIAATYDNGDVNLYFNGTFQNSDSVTEITDSSSSVYLGIENSHEYGWADFYGKMDEVLIFNRVLSADEIASLYNSSANQCERNFTGLSDGVHNFTGYDPDRAGNSNQTGTRNVTVDTIDPNVNFIDPTPENDTYLNQTWANISLNTNDTNQHYSFVDFNNSLLGWWRMDDVNSTGEGATVYDESINNNEGVANNNANQTENGYFGDGFYFDGDDDYIKVNSSDSLNESNNGDTTVNVWYRKDDVVDSYYQLYTPDFASDNNTWHMVTVIYHNDDNNNVTLYYDGNYLGSHDMETKFADIENGFDLYMGGLYTTQLYYDFNGTIDEFLLFKRALNSSEIKSLYNSTVNQYNNNFTGLSDGEHNFTGYAVDRAGNKNQTEKRNVFIDSQKPNISFIDPTLSNDTHKNTTYVNVNISSSDENQHYTFLDFNESLQLWMRMDEASSSGEGATVYDESTHSNDGIAFANANQTDKGKYGKGFSFDGQNDCINLGSNPILANSDNYTISLWFNTTVARSGTDSIYYEKSGGIDWLYLYHIPNTGYIWFQHTSGGVCSMSADINANNGEWHHVVVARNGSFFEIFHNGISVASDTASVGDMLSFTNSSIGGDLGGSTNSFDGTMDEVLLFNRTLSLNEIKSVYNSTVNQYDANMTGLIDKSYNYTGYAIDSAGSINQTEKRVVTVDTINPAVAFNDSITPINGSQSGDSFITVGLNTSDANQHYSFVDFNESCILWMRMDDINSTGDPQDLSSYNHHGEISNNAIQNLSGYFGKSFYFDGSSAVRLTESSILDFNNTNDLSVSAWINSENVYPLKGIVTQNSFGGFSFTVNNSHINLFSATNWKGKSNRTIQNNTWTHVAFNYSNGDFTFFINGEPSGSGSGVFSNSTARWDIGDWLGTYLFKGRIDEVLMFNRSLTELEMKSLYNSSSNQYQHNFTSLPEGNYTFTGYGADRAGNKNQTEQRWRNISYISPTVITTEATGIEENNATMRGTLEEDGGEACTVRFEYGYDTSYGDNTTNQTINEGEDFFINESGLREGTLYHYRAYAENSVGDDVGDDMQFLTKPRQPDNFMASAWNQSYNQINLTWYVGDGANRTVIVRNRGSYPTDLTDGVLVYNNTGNSYNDDDLSPGVIYYYRAWSYSNWSYNSTLYQQWSDDNASDDEQTFKLNLINCSTDSRNYVNGTTATFTAWINATIGDTVALLIANSTENLNSANYTNRNSCISNSSNITITSQPQQIISTMTANNDLTWYAKAYSVLEHWDYIKENTTAWNKTYHSQGNDYANSVAFDSNDNVYVAGHGTDLNHSLSNTDWWIMRFNGSTGIREWNKTYNGGGTSLYGDDYANSVAVDSNDNVYVVGRGDAINQTTSGNKDMWIMKFNGSTGVREWNKTYSSGEYSMAESVAVDSNDNVYVVGSGRNLNHSDSGDDWWIMKFNGSTGVREWNKTYNGGGTGLKFGIDSANSVAVDSNDNVYIVGYGSTLNGSSNTDWWIMKFNGSTGVRDWNKTYNANSSEQAYSVSIDSNDNVYVVGKATNLNYSSSGFDWWFMKFNGSTGVRDWNKTYDVISTSVTYPESVTVDLDNNIFIAGYGTDLNGTASGYDWLVKKINKSGNEDSSEWNISIDSNLAHDRLYCVNTDSNNNIYLTGNGYDLNSSTTGYDWWIKKFEYIKNNYTVSLSFPNVTTNESTGVEEYNATLHGYLLDNGGEICTVRFEYGTTTSYGTNTTNQTATKGEEFSQNTGIASLVDGTLYHYRAYANNTEGDDHGEDMQLLTKPLCPTDFNANQYNQTSINLTWSKPILENMNNTIIVRKIGSYPSNVNDGTEVYNDTGTSYDDTNLDQKTRYFYSAWSYAYWTYNGTYFQKWSDEQKNATAATSTLKLVNCTTDRNIYGEGDTATFSAWIDADIGSDVVLLIASNVSNINNCNYTSRSTATTNSTNVTITQQPQELTATMSATTNFTWYAKACDSEGRCSYMFENTSWNKSYDANEDSDTISSIAIDTSNNIYVAGNGNDLNGSSGDDWWIKKLNIEGIEDTTNWNKSYDAASEEDVINAIAVDSSDNLLVVGYGTNLNHSSSGNDWWIMKFDGPTGERQWNLTYSSYITPAYDRPYSVAIDSNNDVYVVGIGYKLNGTSQHDWWIMKFDGSTGERLYNKSYDSGMAANQNDVAYSVAVDSNDNVYVGGFGKYLQGVTVQDWWIKKFDSDLNEDTTNWNKSYDLEGLDDAINSICIDSNDYVYVVGEGTRSLTSQDWWIKKFQSDGTEITLNWNKTFDGALDNDEPFYCINDSDNNLYVVGKVTNINNSTSGSDWFIKRYDSSGNEDTWQWNISFDATQYSDRAYSVAVDSNDNVFIVGDGGGLNGSTGQDWWIKKFEYMTGSYNVLNESKEILKKSRSEYSLEINPAGNRLSGFVGGTEIDAPIDTEWHYVTLTFGSGTMRLYKDGVEVNSTSGVSIGSWQLNSVKSGLYLTGHMDEIRISSSVRSSAWINTTYHNLNDPTSFARFESPLGVLSTWTYRKKITINSSMIDNTLTDFPVLVYNSSDMDLSSNSLLTGNDIIFMDTTEDWKTGTWRNKLAHEIEKFDNSTGELVAWVKIPTVYGSTDTEFYMYFSNDLCNSNKQDHEDVWDSKYVLVQHLNGTEEFFDSTSYDNDGRPTNIETNDSGKINGAVTFLEGNESNIALSEEIGDYEDLTVSFWVYTHTKNNYRAVAFSGKSGPDNSQKNWAFETNNDADQKMRLQISDGTNKQNVESSNPLPLNCWVHYAGVFDQDASYMYFYTNGTQVSSSFVPILDDVNLAGNGYTTIGASFNQSDEWDRFYDGTIDEFRVSNMPRNASWINVSYKNVAYISEFFSFSNAEIMNVAPVQSNPNPSDEGENQDENPMLSILVNDTNSDLMNVTFRTNASGSWQDIGSNNSVSNGTYYQTPSNMSEFDTTYYWSVNVTDGLLWTNDTYSFSTLSCLIIRPNGEGNSTELSYFEFGQPGDNWKYVDEEIQNENNDYVYTENVTDYLTDVYNLTDHTDETGQISKIIVNSYCTAWGDFDPLGTAENNCKSIILYHGTYYDGTAQNLSYSGVGITYYDKYNDTFEQNPYTGSKWTWEDIDVLQAGISLIGDQYPWSRCTQVYVEVVYEEE